MAINKVIDPAGWDFGRRVTQSVKVSSRGLIGNDRSDFLKTASHEFVDLIDRVKVASDEEPIHVIAMGAGESWGSNRNGDFFRREELKKQHPTFEKDAKFFRDHKNKDKSISYGYVKKSAFNDAMDRVELLCMLNKTKEAAERNDGFIADRELEKLAKGDDIAVSMACVLDPDYPVLTRDRGYVSIVDITTSDYVWTHKGRWRKVVQLNRRQYTGDVVTLEISGLPFPVALTADHLMWAQVFSESPTAVDADNGDVDPGVAAGWQHVSHVRSGDLFFHKPVVGHYPGLEAVTSVEEAFELAADGSTVKTGQITAAIFNSDFEVRKAFLAAWMGNDEYRDNLTSGSALQGRDLLASVGIPCNIQKDDDDKYTLQSTSIFDKSSMTLQSDGTFAYHVRSVSVAQVQDAITYNFEVEEDESYSLGGMISHNCRVPYDVCSSCGNKAKTRKDYCTESTCVSSRGEKRGGCKHNLSKISEDGHILHVDNPDPRFFDISNVHRPADRTAYGNRADYLTKAASHSFLPGAEMADMLGITTPPRLLLSGLSTTLPGRVSNQIKLAAALAILEDRPRDDKYIAAMDARITGSFDTADLSRIGAAGSTKAASALTRLADSRIVLSLKDFAAWTNSSADYEKASSHLQHSFNYLIDRPDMESLILGNPFRHAHQGNVSRDSDSLVAKYRDKYAMDAGAAGDRIIRYNLRNYSRPVVKQAAVNDSLGKAESDLLISYSLYKLAALERMTSSDKDFATTARIALAQNCV